MTNQELFSQAIADAKAVRDAAVANAKAALEETFTPKIMSMLSTKLQELEEEGLEEKKMEEEGYGKEKKEEGYNESDSMEETDLEEILAQLEAEEKGKQEEGKKEVEESKKEMEETKKKEVEEGKKEVEEAKEKKEEGKKVEESLTTEADEDDEVTELTVDELKDIIRDVLKDVLAGTEEEEGEGEIDLGDEAGEEEVEDEESISLDELLAELDKEEEGKKPVEEKKEVEEEGKKPVEEKKEVEEGKKKEMEEAKKEMDEAKKKEMDEAKKDLEEAIATIKTLQAELNEVNLLNAKLLYTNKIFKAKSLNEAQKVKVLKAFDKATNVKEVKVIYESLTESLNTKTKSTIKESVGFASKAAGVAPAQPIVESDSAIRRMQQLAGIVK